MNADRQRWFQERARTRRLRKLVSLLMENLAHASQPIRKGSDIARWNKRRSSAIYRAIARGDLDA